MAWLSFLLESHDLSDRWLKKHGLVGDLHMSSEFSVSGSLPEPLGVVTRR
jgi:hypothetical protein